MAAASRKPFDFSRVSPTISCGLTRIRTPRLAQGSSKKDSLGKRDQEACIARQGCRPVQLPSPQLVGLWLRLYFSEALTVTDSGKCCHSHDCALATDRTNATGAPTGQQAKCNRNGSLDASLVALFFRAKVAKIGLIPNPHPKVPPPACL